MLWQTGLSVLYIYVMANKPCKLRNKKTHYNYFISKFIEKYSFQPYENYANVVSLLLNKDAVFLLTEKMFL